MTKQELKQQLADMFGVVPEELNGQVVADLLAEADSFAGVNVFWGVIPSEISLSRF